MCKAGFTIKQKEPISINNREKGANVPIGTKLINVTVHSSTPTFGHHRVGGWSNDHSLFLHETICSDKKD